MQEKEPLVAFLLFSLMDYFVALTAANANVVSICKNIFGHLLGLALEMLTNCLCRSGNLQKCFLF